VLAQAHNIADLEFSLVIRIPGNERQINLAFQMKTSSLMSPKNKGEPIR